jgi:alpha-beta hydrolase superfamily lysophospholipase
MLLARTLAVWAAGLLLGLALLMLLVALRAYWSETTSLRPARRTLVLPAASELARLEPFELSALGARIRGWYQASHNGALVLLVHGLGGSRAELVPQARVLAGHGYGVLLVDLPGQGESEGHVVAGAPELQALAAALELAAARAPADRLGGYGFSFGASVLLELGAREPRLRALVLEGAPSDFDQQLAFEHRKWGAPALWGARLALRHAGFDLHGYRPLESIRELAPRAVLLIAGLQDPDVPPDMSRRLFDAAGEPRELWLVAGAHHGDAIEQEPEAYERRLVGFFDRYLLAAGGEHGPA